MSSAHLATELAAGLRAADLVARAGVLASANDLASAAAIVAPGLVPFRRALSRLVGRPVGLSGSGPSLWAVYPSGEAAQVAADAVRMALRDGRLAWPGPGDTDAAGRAVPLVVGTTIAAEAAPPGARPAAAQEQGSDS
jgi:hypothetical protein